MGGILPPLSIEGSKARSAKGQTRHSPDGRIEAQHFAVLRDHQVKPAIVVIDSFKALHDLSSTTEELRKFGYELAVNLMAWEATTFLLGEYGEIDVLTHPLFSIVDGLIVLSQREQSSEQQRFIQVVKMRAANHSRDEHSFVITSDGIEVFAPRVTIRREDRGQTAERLLASAGGLGWDLGQEIDRGMLEIVFTPQPEIMVSSMLSPRLLRGAGLLHALVSMTDEYARNTNIKVDFHHDGRLAEVPQDLALAGYRIVQESLTNAARHANASEVQIRVAHEPGRPQLSDGVSKMSPRLG